MALIRWLAALLLFLAAGTAAAQTFPKFSGLVVDEANVLSADQRTALTQKLEALQKDTKRQLVVVTVPDTQGYPLEDYGYRLGRAWGVGLSDADNGAILLLAPGNPAGQRGPRIEVGRGLEPILTDALSSVIVYQTMLPLIRDDKVPEAVMAGTDAIIQQLRASPEEAQAKTDAAIAKFDREHQRRRQQGGGGGVPVALIFWLVILAFVVLPMILRRGGRGQRYRSGPWGDRPRRGGGSDPTLPIVLWGIANEIGRSRGGGWGGGGGSGWGGGGGGSDGSWGGGGFTGGGGGDFGGGGASGDW